jgi:uncharacterized membrane protein
MFITVILSRWLHVVSACLLLGGFFVMRFILPGGLALLEDEPRRQVFLRLRRSFKMVAHSAIFLLLATGIYNTCLAWDKYKLDEAVLHALWGTHILLAGLAIAISLYVLAGRETSRPNRGLMALNVVILALAVAAASSLKWARERAVGEHSTPIVVPETR